MTQADKAISSFRKWLESEPGCNDFQRIVERLMLPLTNQVTRTDDRQELAQDFAVFFLEDFLPGLHRYPDLVHSILTGRIQMVLKFAWTRFHWRLQDRARTRKNNPRGYLYRRIREILTRDNRFTVRRRARDILLYCPTDNAETAADAPALLTPDGYRSWPAPAPSGQENRKDLLFSSEFLARAALFFWQEAASRLDGAFFIEARELAGYLAVHYPWINRPGQDTVPLDEHRLPEADTDTEEQVNLLLALESVACLAAQFTDGLDPESCQVFLWCMEDPPLTYKQIASRLGYPDHNRPYRIQQKTIAAMKKFCASWPGPPLEDLPEEVGLAFIEAVKKQAKKKLTDRKEQ